ncbi:response regulator [Paenibacillus wynnii]|uniref:Chemotaxis protein CheY n=1 Tax=Paenibacillus wynnii TaxID=268407 RepID=A0A098M845_9BACL|nr:response regulator [Paenibacillus wynnii]KGE18208.1 chemotaxis protein CheY [Paenibacillus wynnii]
MIRVLIVDDEKIVRQGLASFMPWKEFGMAVVGEANNGANALQFIETTKVDLLLTDLSMPVMSGIELMREVRQKYPHIQIVVMTLHQDFEYVQEALRLGAIDYVVKTQLEKERFEDVLGRIASLMEQRGPLKATPTQEDEVDLADEIYVLYSLHQNNEDSIMDIHSPKGAVEADVGIWYWTDISEDEKLIILEKVTNIPASNREYALFCFRELQGMDRKSILQLLRSYRKSDLFYEYDPIHPYQIVNSAMFLNKIKSGSSHEINEIKEKWLASEWIYDDQLFEVMINHLKSIKLPSIRLTRIFSSLADEWNRLYRLILPHPILVKDFFSCWFEFETWLRETKEMTRLANTKNQYSNEIQNSIAKAMNMVQRMMNQPLSAGEIAQRVNMSNSYFSQCFKDIVGQTYTDYLRDIRMEKAKEYLRNTNKTVQWISEQIGYNDEKYFSRLFREHVGMVPTLYRKDLK